MFPKITKNILSPQSHRHGMTLLILATLLYVLQDSLIKMLPSTYPLGEIIFFRSFFALMPTLILARIEGGSTRDLKALFKSNFMGGQWLRAIAMVISLGFYIVGCRALPLTEVYALSYTSPLFITLLSGLILKEHTNFKGIIAVFCGFVGVITIIQPGTGVFQLVSIAPVLSGLFTALAVLWGRQLTFQDSTALISMTYLICTLVPSSGTFFLGWETPQGHAWLLLLGIGILGGLAQWFFIDAFRQAPAPMLAPLDYLGILWASLIGVFYFKDTLSLNLILGAFLIIGSGLIMLLKERYQAKIEP